MNEGQRTKSGKTLVREYSDGVVRQLLTKWKVEQPQIPEDAMKQVITRFDQVKSSLGQRLNQIALPERLLQGQKYLDITQYSLVELVKLLKSIPEPVKNIKKAAVEHYVKNDHIDLNVATGYVNRFFNHKNDIKLKFAEGDEEHTKAEVRALIPKQLHHEELYLDIRNWKRFSDLEQFLDTIFPYYAKLKDGEETNDVSLSNGDKVYDKGGIEIYKGDAAHKCISYNPVVTSKSASNPNSTDRKVKYSWCISQPGNSMYDNYRFQSGTNRMFYFVFDRNRPSTPNHKPFDDKFHAIVINVGENNKRYWLTDANNPGELPANTWADLMKMLPKDLAAVLSPLEHLFKYIPPTKAEIGVQALKGKVLSARDFQELDYEIKKQYVQSNAGKLSKDILKILDKDLTNEAINFGQKFSWDDLKDKPQEAKRYAIYRFRHDNYKNNPIPLPFVKYLDEPAKLKYFKVFEHDYLTFEQIQTYFGEEITQMYINDQISKYDYLPKSAISLIKDESAKRLFALYSVIFTNWVVKNATADDKADEAVEQSCDVKCLTDQQWSKLSENHRKALIGLINKFNGISDGDPGYCILYGSPFVIKHQGKIYTINPTGLDMYSTPFTIMDEATGVISKEFKYAKLGDESTDNIVSVDKVYDSKDVEIDDVHFEQFISEMEAINEHETMKMKRYAGIK